MVTVSKGVCSAKSAYKKLSPLIFQVKISKNATAEKNSYGTAFVIKEDGLLITNYHVVADAMWDNKNLKVFVLINNEFKEAEIQTVDYINDLALIKVAHIFKERIKLPKESPEQGSAISTLGLPEDLNWTVITGIFNGIVKDGPYERIHMSNGLNSGMSGGPTVNSSNKLVAVNSSSLKDSSEISFGIPFTKVEELLQTKSISPPTTDKHLIQLQEQLNKLQETMTNQILDGFSTKKALSGVFWPNFSKNTKCWGSDQPQTPKSKYLLQEEFCRVSFTIKLRERNYVGSYQFNIAVFTDINLSEVAKNQLISQRWKIDEKLSANYIEDNTFNYSAPKCTRNRLSSRETPTTVSICAQKLLPLTDVSDVFINLYKQINDKTFIFIEGSLEGFNKKNSIKIIKALTEYNYSEEAL